MTNLMKLSALLIVGVCVFLYGCPSRQTGETSTVLSSASESPGDIVHPVICHLKTRDKLITVRAGEDVVRYTVKSSRGTVLAANLSAEELSARFPELKGVVEQGVADWAGLDPLDQPRER